MSRTDNQVEHDRVVELVLARDLGTISETEHQELETLLRESKSARRLYLQLCSDSAVLHGQAHEDVETLLAAKPSPMAIPESPRKSILWIAAIGWAAAAILIAALVLNHPSGRSPLQVQDSAVAILAAAPDALWEPSSAGSPRVGALLQPGIVSLKSGYAQIEFYSGASVVLEGPAELELIDAKTAKLTKGRLHGQAPKLARGFTIQTPNGRVVDLGTAFGIDLGADGACEVHVMEGLVAVDTATVKDHRVTAGESVSYTSNGIIAKISPNPGKFLGPAQLANLLRTNAEKKFVRWQAHSRELRQSAGLVVYYDFQEQLPWERTITNKANSDVAQGSIIGAHWAEGRFPGKQALELKQISDRIRLNVPGTLENATFAAWVRFDSFDNWLSSLILTEGWSEGEAHWHVTWEGETILGVGRTAKRPFHNYYTPAQVIDTNALGRWVHLVCTYDSEAREVIQYVDGTIVGRETMIAPGPIFIGDAAIGNWSSIDRSKRDVRQINGRIDEFAIFNRVLTQADIQAAYKAGNPY